MVQLGLDTFSFALTEVERSDLYGTRKRLPMDTKGQTCTRAALTSDGSLLIASGMSGQGYFNAKGQYVPRAQLVGIDAKGAVVENKPSTLGITQVLEGPILADGFVWWQISGVSGSGWSAEHNNKGVVWIIPVP